MYLTGGKWNMRRRTPRPSNPFTLIFLGALILGMLYLNQVVVPTIPAMFEPTTTVTRSPESFINEAEQAFKAGKLKAAIEAYKQAILSDPSNPATFVALARLQVFDGQYKDALDSAEKALILNPTYSLAYAVKGWALDFLGNYLDAEGSLRKAIELDPNNALAYAYLAEALMDADPQANIDEASELSRKAKALAPDALESYRARGYVLAQTQNFPEAAEEYKAAIALNDKLWEPHYQLGIIYRFMQEYDLAVSELNTAFSLNPTNAEIAIVLARTQLAAGYYSRAVQFAEDAVRIEPSNPRWHAELGVMLYREKKNYKRSAEELGLAVQGGTTADGAVVAGMPLEAGKIAEYYSFYGFALTQLDRCSDAIPVFQLILQSVGEGEIAYMNALEGLSACQEGDSTPTPDTP